MHYDCLIIGAGQSGLACARIAQNFNLSYVVLEQGVQAGKAWRQRFPELELFTPRSLSSLPGMPLKGSADSLPTSAEMAEYFEEYREKFDINCVFGACVVATESNDDNLWTVTCSDGSEFHTRSLVLANGSNQKPTLPTNLANGLGPEVCQTNAESYWQSMPRKEDCCLVVGDGASGRQIARDLASEGFDVTLSGAGRKMVPNRFFKRNIFHWLSMIGLLQADRDTWLAKILKKRNPVPRKEDLSNTALRKSGVKLAQRVKHTSHAGVLFEDGQQTQFSYVAWCTGYHESTDFLPLDGIPDEEWIIAGRGKLPLPGVFVVGRRWLNNRASELIMGVEHDSESSMTHLRRWLNQNPLNSRPNNLESTNQNV